MTKGKIELQVAEQELKVLEVEIEERRALTKVRTKAARRIRRYINACKKRVEKASKV